MMLQFAHGDIFHIRGLERLSSEEMQQFLFDLLRPGANVMDALLDARLQMIKLPMLPL